MNGSEHANPGFDAVEKRAYAVGVLALGVCAAGAFFQPAQFFQSYLIGYLFWTGIALGSLAIVMLHRDMLDSQYFR